MFIRAGGLANINTMLDDTITSANGARKGSMMEIVSDLAEIVWDQYEIDKDDAMIIISNFGRNYVPGEIAIKAKKKELTLVAITSLDHSKNCQSRHCSGKRLFELADIVIDNCIPGGDSLLEFGAVKSGPGSTLAGVFIVDCILAETLKILKEKGLPLPIFIRQNVDGYNNGRYNKYRSRIKHM